ncbi:MAG: hypothetical protein AAF657_19305 [Acidobacteriota bacterium]
MSYLPINSVTRDGQTITIIAFPASQAWHVTPGDEVLEITVSDAKYDEDVIDGRRNLELDFDELTNESVVLWDDWYGRKFPIQGAVYTIRRWYSPDEIVRIIESKNQAMASETSERVALEKTIQNLTKYIAELERRASLRLEANKRVDILGYLQQIRRKLEAKPEGRP